MSTDPWTDLYSQRKAAAIDALDAGNPCIPLAPPVSLAVLQNTLRSVLVSSPSPDCGMMASMLYVLGPLSAAEASRLIGRKCCAHEDLIKMGAARAVGTESIGRQTQLRLVGSWAVSTLPNRAKSPRPPSIAELREVVAWAIDHVKRRKAEAGGELLSILRWIKQSCSGHSAKPTPRDALPRGAALKKAMGQMREWAEKDLADEAPVTAAIDVLARWIAWTSTEHPHLPEFIFAWPTTDGDRR